MLIRYYRNTLATIKQWFEAVKMTIAPTPILVRVRINKPEPLQQLSARQRRMLNLKHHR
jgi:hypothetical protein